MSPGTVEPSRTQSRWLWYEEIRRSAFSVLRSAFGTENGERRTENVRVPRILLLATTTGYQTRAFGDAAARLGVDLVFATDRCHMLEDPWQDGAIPIRFHEEQASVDAILEVAQTRPFDGILVVGDRPTVIAARAA